LISSAGTGQVKNCLLNSMNTQNMELLWSAAPSNFTVEGKLPRANEDVMLQKHQLEFVRLQKDKIRPSVLHSRWNAQFCKQTYQ
jgi:hypothetical protein